MQDFHQTFMTYKGNKKSIVMLKLMGYSYLYYSKNLQKNCNHETDVCVANFQFWIPCTGSRLRFISQENINTILQEDPYLFSFLYQFQTYLNANKKNHGHTYFFSVLKSNFVCLDFAWAERKESTREEVSN